MQQNKYQKFLEKNKFLPSKKLGQNFLINENIKEKIVYSLSIESNDYVLEIGPGLGALTKIIIKKTKFVKLVEVDKRLVEFLRNNFPNIEIINKDILKFDFNEINKNKYKIISNLPYSVSSKILIKILKEANFECAILMLQKDMIDRIIAKPGTKKYNNFTVLLSLFANIEKLFDVSPDCFYPKPKVYSTVIKFKKKEEINFDYINDIEKFLMNCFSQKRKTIFNNLKQFYEKEKIYKILEKNQIKHDIRPEKIEPKIYLNLFYDFYEI